MEPTIRRKPSARYRGLSVKLILLVVAVLVFVNRQYIFDQIVLFSYQPAPEVVALAEATKMTPTAERYFYASKPTIDERTAFNSNCKNNDEQTIVLGCYTNRQIHVFNVTDPRLPGVKAVTAAHEMLHAAYERLGNSEKVHLKTLIDQELEQLNDGRIKRLIDSYNKTEPGELYNEMHSILGTELRQLPAELEQYYSQYFDNRGTVVRISESYEKVFSGLRESQQKLVDELNILAININERSENLNYEVTRLNSDVKSFNSQASSGQFSSENEFNEQRSVLISRQLQLETERTMIEQLIKEYNKKQDELAAINLEAKSLNSSINSNLTPITTVD